MQLLCNHCPLRLTHRPATSLASLANLPRVVLTHSFALSRPHSLALARSPSLVRPRSFALARSPSLAHLPRLAGYCSANFPAMSVRHQGFEYKITEIHSALDKADADLRVVPALNGMPGAVSFTSKHFPGHYLRHFAFRVVLQPGDHTPIFAADASFMVRPGLAGHGFISFESCNYPGHCACLPPLCSSPAGGRRGRACPPACRPIACSPAHSGSSRLRAPADLRFLPSCPHLCPASAPALPLPASARRRSHPPRGLSPVGAPARRRARVRGRRLV